jgi:hypothetical protein
MWKSRNLIIESRGMRIKASCNMQEFAPLADLAQRGLRTGGFAAVIFLAGY